MQIGRASSGTAANGIGGNLQFTAQDTAGTQRTAAYITWKLAVASSASPQGYLAIGTRNASEALIITDSGNLGLGVTPSAWGSNSKPLQMADGSVWGISSLTGYVSVGGNYYYDGNYKYIKTSNATDYYQYNGQHAWRNAPSGTAGNVITFTQAMTLTAAGRLLLGTTTESTYLLDVNGTGRFSNKLIVNTSISGDVAAEIINTNTTGYGLLVRGGLTTRYAFNVVNATDTVALFTVVGSGAAIFTTSSTNCSIAINNTSNTPYIRFDESGTSKFFIGQRNSVSGDGGTGYDLLTVAGNDLRFFAGNTKALTLATTGAATFTSSVTATSFFESSDSRLKTLIQDNYQTKGIATITPKLYTKNGKVELGYYAQDFVGVLDSAVSKGSDDMLSLSYREVLVAKVYALEQEIKELKGRKFNISTTKLK
jgi:hypothetical protein